MGFAQTDMNKATKTAGGPFCPEKLHFRGLVNGAKANLSICYPSAGRTIVVTHETFSGFFRLYR